MYKVLSYDKDAWAVQKSDGAVARFCTESSAKEARELLELGRLLEHDFSWEPDLPKPMEVGEILAKIKELQTLLSTLDEDSAEYGEVESWIQALRWVIREGDLEHL